MKQNKVIICAMVLLLAACGGEAPGGAEIRITPVGQEESISCGNGFAVSERMEADYRDIYMEMELRGPEHLEVIRSMVKWLGENGYAAVDIGNQTDMVCPEQMREFCGQVEAGEEADAALIVVMSGIRLVQYGFRAKDGKVEVLRSHYRYREGCWENTDTQTYTADTWVYSEEGYLFFGERHMPGFDGPSEHVAVRVEPLDEKCRGFNRKYLGWVGYGLNNLFTSDWSEEDFRELDFYDLYAVLRQNLCQMENAFYKEGITYEIPKSEFESVFQSFFRVDSKVLRQYTVYDEDTQTYRYRERGMFDFAPTPEIPYPEVVSYEENRDGTVKLTVNAVWPEECREKAFCHEVVIRPLEDGGFQYVSNHVIPSGDNVEITWYTERLDAAKWQEYYG